MPGRSPAVILYDGEGNPVKVDDDGVYRIEVVDVESRAILRGCLKELKGIKFMLAHALDLDDLGENL